MRTIELSNSRKRAKVSNGDFNILSQYTWSLCPWGYACTQVFVKNGLSKTITMHKFMFPNRSTDHVNNDRLDNRRKNLRAATKKQNNQNVSLRITSKTGYKGVCWDKSRRRFLCRVANTYVGSFTCKHEAAKAYNKQAAKQFGRFAHLNTIRGAK